MFLKADLSETFGRLAAVVQNSKTIEDYFLWVCGVIKVEDGPEEKILGLRNKLSTSLVSGELGEQVHDSIDEIHRVFIIFLVLNGC